MASRKREGLSRGDALTASTKPDGLAQTYLARVLENKDRKSAVDYYRIGREAAPRILSGEINLSAALTALDEIEVDSGDPELDGKNLIKKQKNDRYIRRIFEVRDRLGLTLVHGASPVKVHYFYGNGVSQTTFVPNSVVRFEGHKSLLFCHPRSSLRISDVQYAMTYIMMSSSYGFDRYSFERIMLLDIPSGEMYSDYRFSSEVIERAEREISRLSNNILEALKRIGRVKDYVEDEDVDVVSPQLTLDI